MAAPSSSSTEASTGPSHLLSNPNILYEIVFKGKYRDIQVNLLKIPLGFTPFIIVVSHAHGGMTTYQIPEEICGTYSQQQAHRDEVARLYDIFKLHR